LHEKVKRRETVVRRGNVGAPRGEKFKRQDERFSKKREKLKRTKTEGVRGKIRRGSGTKKRKRLVRRGSRDQLQSMKRSASQRDDVINKKIRLGQNIGILRSKRIKSLKTRARGGKKTLKVTKKKSSDEKGSEPERKGGHCSRTKCASGDRGIHPERGKSIRRP